MTRLLAFAALALSGVCIAQTTVAVDVDGSTATLLSNIDPSDIATIPDPEVLGPPIGVPSSATASYDAAAVTSSVLAAVTAATDAQTDILSATSTVALSAETGSAEKRSFIGGSTGKVQRRDLSYPIDTTNYNVPSGYTPAFISYPGATQARGYLTYKTLASYDPSLCAAACNKISTCMFMNIYWEKDPDANGNPVDIVKCSMYSMPQTNATTTNKGQYQGKFHVIITGSNGYNKATPPTVPAGYSLAALPAAVNAPLWDRSGQWEFIQPVYLDTYDTGLCAAACDRQTQYDKSTASDSCNYKTCVYSNLYILSQDGVPKTVVCALYTQAVDPSYAVNKGYWTATDSYQVSNSVGLTNNSAVAAGFPQYCAPLASDITYLNSVGSDFCTSYLGYIPPTDTATASSTPSTSIIHATATSTVTVTTYTSTATTTATSSGAVKQRRQDNSATGSDYSINISTVSLVDKSTLAASVLSSIYASPSNGSALAKRTAIPTPASITGWPAAKISAACSQVATGHVTTTATVTAATPLSTVTDGTTAVSSTVSLVTTVTVPAVAISSPTAVVGSLQGSPANYDDGYFTLNLPFAIGVWGKTSSTVYLSLNGAIALEPFPSSFFYPWDGWSNSYYVPDQIAAGFYDDLYIYKGTQQGIYYDIEGDVGSRTVTLEFYTSAFNRPTEYYHFTMAFSEAQPGVFTIKIYQATNKGSSAYVGSQDKSVSPAKEIHYSDNQNIVVPGSVITIDTINKVQSYSTFSP